MDGKGLKSRYKNWALAKKLLYSFGIVIAVTAIMMGFALYFVSRVGYLGHRMYEGPYISTTETETIRADLNHAGIYIRGAIMEKDMEKYNADIDKVIESVNNSITIVKDHFEGDPQLVTNLENSINTLTKERQKAMDAASA